MNFTIKQFENTLRRIIRDETKHFVTKKEFNILVTSVDGLTRTVDSFLNTEWKTHLHDTHPRIEKRLTKVEKN